MKARAARAGIAACELAGPWKIICCPAKLLLAKR
jgi:hypothetical protein